MRSGVAVAAVGVSGSPCILEVGTEVGRFEWGQK